MRLKNLLNHQAKREVMIRYIIASILLLSYSIYLFLRFGLGGIGVSFITWSAFVLSTPIADGGIIIDLPIRLLTKLRMIYSEIIVWIIAILLNIYYLTTNPIIYQKTIITNTFHQILAHPWPNWIIILISALGTFLSLYFGDELLDIIKHNQRIKYFKLKNWQTIIWFIFVIILFYFLYKYFLEFFGLNI